MIVVSDLSITIIHKAKGIDDPSLHTGPSGLHSSANGKF